MATLSGMVAVLNVAGDAVIETRDLGPVPVGIKGDRARPLVEDKPAINPATQEYGAITFEIQPNQVIRHWAVVTKPTTDEMDTSVLNAQLMEPGSVLKAIAEVQFGILKGTITIPQPALTVVQYRNMLKQRMRT